MDASKHILKMSRERFTVDCHECIWSVNGPIIKGDEATRQVMFHANQTLEQDGKAHVKMTVGQKMDITLSPVDS